MANLNLNSATVSNQQNLVPDLIIPSQLTDAATGQKEYFWTNPKATQYFGYFNSVPDLKSALIMKSTWNLGKGFTTDTQSQVILDHIKGFGKETFGDILFSLDIGMRIFGDSFAEIIRDPKTGQLVNIKVLDPSVMRIVFDQYGIILRYEQLAKNPQTAGKEAVQKKGSVGSSVGKTSGIVIQIFKPEEILHFCHNRISDQIHGISDIEGMQDLILAEQESFLDTKKASHRQARPLLMFKLRTDDPTKIQQFANKMDQATANGENIYVPEDENTISWEIIQTSISQTMLSWRDDIRKKFYRTIRLPELIPSGGGDSTESGGKIGYLAFEQVVAAEQAYIERQVWNQLFIKIKLNAPASLQAPLQQDNQKDGANNLNGEMGGFQPNDMMAGVGQ